MQTTFENNDRHIKSEIQLMQNTYAQQLQQAQDREAVSAQEMNLQFLVAENRMDSKIASLRTRLTESQAREKHLREQRPPAEPDGMAVSRPIMSPISAAASTIHASPPHLPNAQGPPRSISPRISLFSRKKGSEDGNTASGTARGDPGAENEETAPEVPIPGIARGDLSVNGERPRPNLPMPGFAGGDPGVKKEQFSFAASGSAVARGDPCGTGPQTPRVERPKEEDPSTSFIKARFRRLEPCPANTSSSSRTHQGRSREGNPWPHIDEHLQGEPVDDLPELAGYARF